MKHSQPFASGLIQLTYLQPHQTYNLVENATFVGKEIINYESNSG
ncbi:MAG: hypothetical protein AAF632_11115 [Bacteroidota bacterium]